jgi:hypothetical protein
MRKIAMLLALVSLVGLGTAASAAGAATTFTISQNYPFAYTAFVPCAAGGAGETVELSGNVHELIVLTFNASGGFATKSLINNQGVSGVGLTTGTQYRGVGVSQRQLTINPGVQDTFVITMSVIGQGSGNNLLVRQTMRVTINANGELTVLHVDSTVDCG